MSRSPGLPLSFHGGGVEGLDLAAALGDKCLVLLNAMRMKTVDPKYGVICPVAHRIRPPVCWELCNSPQPKRSQCRVVNTAERAESETPITVWSIMKSAPAQHLW